MATKSARVAKRAPVTKPDGNKALKVIPRGERFRRAGFLFTGETIIPLTDLTDEQYNALTNEPALVTTLVDLPQAAAAEE